MKVNWRQLTGRIGVFEAAALIALGIALALVIGGGLDPVALIILLVWGYVVWAARGMVRQAQRFRPVEPPRTWLVTLVANIALTALGLGAFGWYLLGGGTRAWLPFLGFIVGMIALRQWRRGVVNCVYAWRTPALTLLQQGEYKKLVRALEDDPLTARNPDRLAMLALAQIELNKWQAAEQLLMQARALAPDFASVNGAIGALRRHQARWDEAAQAIRMSLAFEENANSRYYLGFCQFLQGDHAGARATLSPILDDPTLIRQGQVVGAYILGQVASAAGDAESARGWYARMSEGAPKVIPLLEDEMRRHKQTPYAETLKEHVRVMQRLVARRGVAEEDVLAPTDKNQ